MGKMFDSTNAKNIPTDAKIVAGYVNGRYAWRQADWDLHSQAIPVPIQIFIPGQDHTPIKSALVLDVEANDAAKPQAQQAIDEFVVAKNKQGIIPCIYTSQSTLHYVWRGRGVDYWIATLDGRERLVPGCCATQYVDTGPYDVSLTQDWWPRNYAQSQEGIPPMPNGQPVGISLTPSGKGYLIVGSDGGTFAYGDQPEVPSLPGANIVPAFPIEHFDVTQDRRGIVFMDGHWEVYALGTAEYAGHP